MRLSYAFQGLFDLRGRRQVYTCCRARGELAWSRSAHLDRGHDDRAPKSRGWAKAVGRQTWPRGPWSKGNKGGWIETVGIEMVLARVVVFVLVVAGRRPEGVSVSGRRWQGRMRLWASHRGCSHDMSCSLLAKNNIPLRYPFPHSEGSIIRARLVQNRHSASN